LSPELNLGEPDLQSSYVASLEWAHRLIRQGL
jgi:hypothetical protein